MKTSTEPKVLECLALHSPANKWQIANLTRKSYANIHEAVSKLKQKNMIKTVKVEASSKNPNIKVEYYTLTEIGLYHAFQTLKISEQALNRIAERYPHICLTFKKWNSIKDKDIKKFILGIFEKKCLEEMLIVDLFSRFRERKRPIDSDLDLEAAKQSFERLDKLVFQLSLLAASEEVDVFNKLLLVVKNDEELKNFALKFYENFEKTITESYKHITEIKNALSS